VCPQEGEQAATTQSLEAIDDLIEVGDIRPAGLRAKHDFIRPLIGLSWQVFEGVIRYWMVRQRGAGLTLEGARTGKEMLEKLLQRLARLRASLALSSFGVWRNGERGLSGCV
jgi:hypothetical protein